MPDRFPPPDDIPAFPADGYAPLADAFGRILKTRNDVVLIQAEAVVALEAVATSLGRPGRRALNIVTSLYGRWFGAWLRRQGTDVVDLEAAPGYPITTETVDRALRAASFDMLALVHAESASGIANPLAEIMAVARARGVTSIVDAVASVGGHAVEVDALGIDIAVVGPQKALGGQAGVSAVSVSARGWSLAAPPGAAPSILSLSDQRALWLDQGRGALPGTPSALEFHALRACLNRVESEGIAACIARHADAARIARAGVLALIGRLHVPDDQASNLVTAVPLPPSVTPDRALAALPPGHGFSAGVGPGAEQLLRLNHTGPHATPQTVLQELAALAEGLSRLDLKVDVRGAMKAAETAAAQAKRIARA